jgi:hypothetical protein
MIAASSSSHLCADASRASLCRCIGIAGPLLCTREGAFGIRSRHCLPGFRIPKPGRRAAAWRANTENKWGQCVNGALLATAR